MTAPRSSLRQRFAEARSGVTSLEFALLGPILMVMLIGTYETTQLVRAYMTLGVATQAMADLLSHGDPDTSAQVTDACNGARLVMAPFTAANFSASIVALKNNAGTVAVNWTSTSCGTPTAMTSAAAITLGSPLVPNAADETFIVQSNYTYNARTSLVLNATFALGYQAFARPRVPPP